MLFLLNTTSAFGIPGFLFPSTTKIWRYLFGYTIISLVYLNGCCSQVTGIPFSSSSKFSIIYVQFMFIMVNLLYHVLLYIVEPVTPFTKLQKLFYSDNSKFKITLFLQSADWILLTTLCEFHDSFPYSITGTTIVPQNFICYLAIGIFILLHIMHTFYFIKKIVIG